MNHVNWGILGCGHMAQKFVDDLKLIDSANCLAAASKDQHRANSFATFNQIPKAYDSYEALVKDEEVDIVYVATRNTKHFNNTINALNHEKAVLCEKPFAMQKSEVEQMVSLAKEKQVFLMEALWTRFLPITIKAKEIVDSGEIGEVKQVQADFGFIADASKTRLFDKHQGGGSLLDIGIYPIFMAELFLGQPNEIAANAFMNEQGVDLSCGMIFKYNTGQQAILSSTLLATTQNQAWIHGTEASLQIHARFHESEQISIYKNLKKVDDLYSKKIGSGYTHEIEHVHECLKKGIIESPLMSHKNSLSLIQSIDRVRKEIGLEFD